MYLTLLLIPLISSLVAGLFGRLLGITGVKHISLILITITIILTIITFYEVVINDSVVYIYLINWINTDVINADWTFQFDNLTISILLAVIIVSTIVHYFSFDYISSDPHLNRFICYLGIFTFFIVILVTGDNYIILFLGWEGIGVASYLLVGFWFTRLSASKAAIQAITVNRIGDIFLTISCLAIIAFVGTLNYDSIFHVASFTPESILTFIGFIFLFAAIGKSAQIGLHTWLPYSIEGPTPVSALIHAATLVTAGVYLLIRSWGILEWAPIALIGITWIGALTTLFAGLSGILQNDIKRIIAFSTCSQIGYLFIAVGLSQYNVALFHLVNHAFFKSLLFLAAGGVLHAVSDIQDIRRLGGLVQFLPITYISILIGSLSLIAIPWLSGFISKDLILELAYGTFEIKGILVYVLGSLSAGLTGYYSIRLLINTFFGAPNANNKTYNYCHETTSIFVFIPYIVLALFSIFFGYLFSDLYVGIGANISMHTLNDNLVEAHYAVPVFWKNIPLILTLLGAITAIWINNKFIEKYTYIYTFFNYKWFIDVIYIYIIKSTLNFGYSISKYLDRGIIEYIGPYGLTNSIQSLNFRINSANLTLTNLSLYTLIAILLILIFIFNIGLDIRLIILILLIL